MNESKLICNDDNKSQDTVLVIKSPTQHQISTTLVVSNCGCTLNKLILILPIPKTNIYQTISNIEINQNIIDDINELSSINVNGLTILTTKCDNKYIHYSVPTDSLPSGNDQSITLILKYNVTLNDISVDFNKIYVIFPYNTDSAIYKRYTKQRDGPFIDCNNKDVKLIGDRLWKQSDGNILEYANNVYNYIASNFKYTKYEIYKPKDISDIFRMKGGECGDITTIFVNLLRYKHIPCRHLQSVRPDGTFHVWSDFYLEKYGWIPVDCTYKLNDKTGNYFGLVSVKSNGIILNNGINFKIQKDQNEIYYTPFFQDYLWWDYYSNVSQEKDCKCSISQHLESDTS